MMACGDYNDRGGLSNDGVDGDGGGIFRRRDIEPTKKRLHEGKIAA